MKERKSNGCAELTWKSKLNVLQRLCRAVNNRPAHKKKAIEASGREHMDTMINSVG
jgi:hypothetical protein